MIDKLKKIINDRADAISTQEDLEEFIDSVCVEAFAGYTDCEQYQYDCTNCWTCYIYKASEVEFDF
ncbi:MAG: hypothetical protein ACRCX2_39345 [Paraclostridium sp.]